MKKGSILAVTFALMAALLCACGGNTDANASTLSSESSGLSQGLIQTSEDSTTLESVEITEKEETSATESEESATKYKIGEKVSTNTVEFTLDEAVFTIACSNSVDDTYLFPKEYDATKDSKNPFVAPVGKTLVALTFTIKNNDRTTLKVADSSAWNLYWKVSYNGEEYPLNGQGDMDYGLIFRNAVFNVNDSGWVKADTHNKYVNAGDTLSVRTYGTISTDVNNLDDGFDLIISIPSSNGLETFTYSIDDKTE